VLEAARAQAPGGDVREWDLWEIFEDLCVGFKRVVPCSEVDEARVLDIQLLRAEELKLGIVWPVAHRFGEGIGVPAVRVGDVMPPGSTLSVVGAAAASRHVYHQAVVGQGPGREHAAVRELLLLVAAHWTSWRIPGHFLEPAESVERLAR
jgi:hypothetical protein